MGGHIGAMLRGVIGVVHLAPMPGDPLAEAATTFEEVLGRALADAEALARGGAQAMVVENFGSAPFYKGTEGARLPAHQVALMALAVARCREATGLPVGVNCLRNDAMAALGIAAATGAAFVRVNVHVGAYVTDQGIIEGEAAASLRYRSSLGAAGVAILADVLVKHAAPLVPVDAAQAARDTVGRGRADGLVVTGRATGAPIDDELLALVRGAVPDAPLYAGSGLTPENAARLAPHVHGAIVGTYVKRDGDVRAPVELERVRRLVEATHDAWRS